MPPQQSGSAGRRLDRSEACGERDPSPACCDHGSCDDPDPRQITKQCASFSVPWPLRDADVHPECTIIICQVRRMQRSSLRRHRLHLALQVFFTMIPTRPSNKKLRLRRTSLSVSPSRCSPRCDLPSSILGRELDVQHRRLRRRVVHGNARAVRARLHAGPPSRDVQDRRARVSSLRGPYHTTRVRSRT